MTVSLAAARFPAIGTTATVIVDGGGVSEAEEILRDRIDELDRTCSRFRPDSELSRLQAGAAGSTGARPGGAGRPVSQVLFDAVAAALWAAATSGGLVDPTIGCALSGLGYDRDFALLDTDGPITLRAVPGWQAVRLDARLRTLAVPAGVQLDLGATAKAFCADRVASEIAAHLGTGVLVSLGGDIAVSGSPPVGGWPIAISADHRDDPLSGEGPVVSISSGGLATSSTSVRRWIRGGRPMHHVVDPRTSWPAVERWRCVSVAAASCLEANTASCAAIVLGDSAPDWLARFGVPARLQGEDGSVVTVGEWPADPTDPAAC
jgi:thiamine biosynthesis lipoprotein